MQLVKALESAEISLLRGTNHSKKELQDFARNNGVDLYVDKADVSKGWEGTPKGLLQVLRERGLIDLGNVSSYTVDGRKDPITGEVDNSSSSRYLMGRCPDFRDEETALEHLALQLGVELQLTPKFHAELAGEGIEYNWAHSKGYYRRQPVSSKKGRDNFKKLVRECTSPEHLPIKRVRLNAARARAYISTYFQLAMKERADEESHEMTAQKQQVLFSEIERLMKTFKTHRCALDFDRGFVNGALKRKEP